MEFQFHYWTEKTERDSYDGHEREDVVLEVVSVISSHLDVDGDEDFDVPLHRV